MLPPHWREKYPCSILFGRIVLDPDPDGIGIRYGRTGVFSDGNTLCVQCGKPNTTGEDHDESRAKDV